MTVGAAVSGLVGDRDGAAVAVPTLKGASVSFHDSSGVEVSVSANSSVVGASVWVILGDSVSVIDSACVGASVGDGATVFFLSNREGLEIGVLR
jgi:hypothetical protein